MLSVFVPREVFEEESRVAATPETVRHYVKAGLAVHVEAGAGHASGFPDPEYEEAGAQVSGDAKALFGTADVILKVNPPEMREDLGAHEADLMKNGALLVSFLYPAVNPDVAEMLGTRGVVAFAMDLVPRITRAQKMDALSSQSNLAGYKAVVIAADHMKKIFPMLMTAAGTIKPVRVVIIGAGVAGLQAIATAKRLGAIVSVNDVRPAVKEQVESLGGRFIDMPTPEDAEDAGGYAKDLGEDFLAKQRQILADHIAQSDAVITTALIPGKPAPRIVSEEMVRGMRPGSVVVDLAAVMGGNCELTVPGETVTRHDVVIVGEKNLPGMVPFHASELYARNVLEVVKLNVTEGALSIDPADEINQGSIAVNAPPPPPPEEPTAEEAAPEDPAEP
ncbi:MAG: Re/Si-specific NAD(P)(+) transhydrogenase subunit alpha, partial [Planctomycetota bacterium]